jgi:hypothetical protein
MVSVCAADSPPPCYSVPGLLVWITADTTRSEPSMYLDRARGWRVGGWADGVEIIRSADYADPDLAHLALESVELWRKPEWEGTYHE